MTKRILFLLLFLSLSLEVLYSDTGVAGIETVFLPRDYFVGDRVELRIKLTLREGYYLSPAESLPESIWINFISIEILDDPPFQEIRIVFVPFIPGTRSLPVVRLGNVVLDSVRIHTSSLTADPENDFRGIAGQLVLPGTRLAMAIAAGIIFIGPVMLLVLWGPVRKRIMQLIESSRGRLPYRRLSRALKELEDQLGKISCRRFYIRLSDALRVYLSKRTAIDFVTMTTADTVGLLDEAVGDRDLSGLLAGMLLLSDKIKFGGETTEDSRKYSDIALVRNVSRHIELKNSRSGIKRSGN